MNDIIFNVLPAQGPTIPIWIPILGGIPINAFLPPLVGSFFGVIVAFAFNYKYQSYRNVEDKKKYKAMMRSEIELCLNILKEDRVRMLPVDRWTSALNSGALKLFDADIELVPLSRVYNKIQNYNHDTTFSFPFETWTDAEPRADSREYREDRRSLLEELELLKNKEWLKLALKPGEEEIKRKGWSWRFWR